MSLGKDGTSSSESILEGRKSSLGTTVAIKDSTVSGDTSVSDPVGSKGLGCGGKFSRNWNAHILTSDTHTPRVSAVLTSFIKTIRATVHTYIQTTSVIDN